MKHFHIESGTKYLVGNPLPVFLKRSISNAVYIHTKIRSRTPELESFEHSYGVQELIFAAFETALDSSQCMLQRKKMILA